MKVLHVLYQSLPQVSGSSIRSRDIMLSQKEVGIEVLAITAPFQNCIRKMVVIPLTILHILERLKTQKILFQINEKVF